MSDALVANVVKPLLITAALPAAAAGLGVLASRMGGRRRWPVGLFLAAGLISSFVLIAGVPALPPKDVLHWLPIAAGAALLLGLLDEWRKQPSWLRLSLHGLLFAATAGALLRPFVKRWEPATTGLWLAGLSGAALLLWWALDKPARKTPLPFALAPLVVGAGAFAGVMVLSGSAKSSQLSGALAAGLGGLALAGLVKKLDRVDGAPLAVGLLLFAGVLSHAQLFTDVHPVATSLCFLSALTGALGRVPLIGLLPSRKLLALGLLAAALPAAAALLFAWSLFEPNPYAY